MQDYASCLKLQSKFQRRNNTLYSTLTTNLRKRNDSLIVNVAKPGTDTQDTRKLSHPHLLSNDYQVVQSYEKNANETDTEGVREQVTCIT